MVGATPELTSVAMTCPKVKLSGGNKIHKCCPLGEVFQDLHHTTCGPPEHEGAPWRIPINGHLYSERELVEADKLVYEREFVSQLILGGQIILVLADYMVHFIKIHWLTLAEQQLLEVGVYQAYTYTRFQC